MSHRFLLTAACAGLLTLLPACFDAPAPACTLGCGENGACPTGYVCGDGNLCHLLNDDGSLAACPEQIVDAATPDAATPDAAE